MAASNTSGPNESGGLSAREQKVLAEIEYDLFVADPPSPVTWSAPTGPGPGSDRGQPSGTSRRRRQYQPTGGVPWACLPPSYSRLGFAVPRRPPNQD